MGLLTTGGNPMQWGTDENNRALPHVSEHGIKQFVLMFQRNKDVDNSPFVWGEEIEHVLVKIDGDAIKLSVTAAETLDRLRGVDPMVDWRPEYGSFMVESVPGRPYTLELSSLLSVEDNMRRRYELIDKYAGPGVVGLTLVTFPLMGVGKFTTSDATESPYSHSLFVPDVCINGAHPRFANLTRNIRLRRGRKVCIQVPLYLDTHTLERTVDKRLNIDQHPRNKDIDCSVANPAESEKKKKGSKFGSKSFSTTSTASAFAAALSASSSTSSSLVGTSDPTSTSALQQQQLTLPLVSPTGPLPPSTESEHPAAAALTHLYTPATDYYYAQYSKKSNKRECVRQRYEACPCPVPSVSHPCVYMDCMAFGMGCHCLQVTMQLRNIDEARSVYDQLAVLCPPFLALTSSTPFQKGLLCDSDVRWLTIAASVDDRRRDEVEHILKSRYDSVSVFINAKTENLDAFNDNAVPVNSPFYTYLIEQGVDAPLSRHIAHLFIRDPLVMYDQMIDIDDHTHNEHFENIQSTNWQTVRFKPPPTGGEFGWRVEFRVMDVMPTPFENAALSVFVVLLTRAIIKYNLMFYSKMSTVDENMGRAHQRNPCNLTYVMRKNIYAKNLSIADEEFAEFTIDEIFNGTKDATSFVGLVPIVKRFLKEEGLESPLLTRYLTFISMRASGKIPTAAQYLRRFIVNHADYKHDSRVTPSIAKDIVNRVHSLAAGTITDDSFLPMELFGPIESQSEAERAKRPRKENEEDIQEGIRSREEGMKQKRVDNEGNEGENGAKNMISNGNEKMA